MFNFLDMQMIKLQTKMRNFAEDFKKEERGASDIVAILLIILVVVAIAFVFKKQLGNLVNNVFNKVGENTSDLTSH